jgi:hypothetical protein
MEQNLQRPLEDGDLATVAEGLARVPKFVPDPAWNAGPQGWSALAKATLDAAKGGDGKATGAACKTCHKAWRSKYKQSFRQRPIPE